MLRAAEQKEEDDARVKTIMNWLGQALMVLLTATSVWTFFQVAYATFLSLFGFGHFKRDYEPMEDRSRFLILIAAHNEEPVIADTLRHLESLDYDPSLYEICVVNDNSTDRTGEICEQMGVKHIDTAQGVFPREGTGKPGGLQYALRALGYEELQEKFDLLMVLDADNYVDDHILKELNAQWLQKGKPEVIQSYLDSKNTSSLLALGYATAYWSTNRFFQMAKYRLGLPNSIGGTGFVVRMDWLIGHGGFCYRSLTEDLEMEIEIVKGGGRILWNHFARIYDEKPDSARVSLRQRTRWAQGHWYVAFHNAGALMRAFIKDGRKFCYIDQLIYLFGMSRGVLVLVTAALTGVTGISMIIGHAGGQIAAYLLQCCGGLLFPTTAFSVLLCIYSLGITAIYAAYVDGGKPDPLRAIAAAWYSSILCLPTQIVGLLRWRRQSVWIKTPHKHTSETETPGSSPTKAAPDSQAAKETVLMAMIPTAMKKGVSSDGEKNTVRANCPSKRL